MAQDLTNNNLQLVTATLNQIMKK